MDDLLPSYESATKQNPWELVARYLPSNDLCAAALVCQKWHKTFTPQLWGDPASHFGVQNDTVYVALTRFKRTLLWSRLSVRELTHTLRLPPAHPEIYGGPHYEWLRDCLERLPRLQSLIVDKLPFFDHAALLTLRHPSVWWNARRAAWSKFGLRLLDASSCTNVTPSGLSEALPLFPDLVSLDLSRTKASKDGAVLDTLRYLPNLRVLKLRGLGLKDRELQIIASSITTRVRSLDISKNLLTDESVRLLLQHCFQEVVVEQNFIRTPLPLVHDSHPLGELDIFGTENLETHLRKKLTTGFVGSLAVEDARDLGITHLYISDNNLTVEGVSHLIPSKRLQALDIGTLSCVAPMHTSIPDENKLGNCTRGLQQLTPVLAYYAAEKLAYLRINVAVITIAFNKAPRARAELKGQPAYVPHTGFVDSSILALDATKGISPVLSGAESSFVIEDGLQLSTPKPRQNSTYYVEERRAKLQLRQSQENTLHPGMLPKVRTLVLTDVPTTADATVVRRLIRFIEDCAEETEIARIQAAHTYALPPGRSRKTAERDYAHELFSLSRIVLEMAPPKAASKKISSSWREYPTKSSTEDPDSEAFWQAAAHDFSFFGDEEVSKPAMEPGNSLPIAAMSGLDLVERTPVPTRESKYSHNDLRSDMTLDVVAEISKFRKARKAAYMASLQLGETDSFVEGYWSGKLTVVRKPTDQDDGDIDYHGNKFEPGWLYR